MSLTVIKPGMLSVFQDLGRTGNQHLGVPVGGAMDARAHRLANLLAGNDASAATLEITLTGPTLRFDQPACFALAGADLGATLNGQPAPLYRPLIARAGDLLAWKTRKHGARAYLAVHGGFQLDTVMGSDSTNLRSGFGGYQGRALRKDDRVTLRRPLSAEGLDELDQALWQQRISLPSALGLAPRDTVRVIPGPHWDEFSFGSQDALLRKPWRIGVNSDRMGYRLEGPKLTQRKPRQILSEGIGFGAMQVPQDGAPIVLMADRQTTGGYPKMAHVASVDLPALSQAAPGEHIRFESITLQEAQRLDALREAAYARVAQAMQPMLQLLAQHEGAPA